MRIIIIAILTFGLYALAVEFINLPAFRRNKLLKNIRPPKSSSEIIYQSILMPVIRKTSRYIRLDEFKERNLRKKLARAGIQLTPREYYAQAAVYALISLIMVPIFSIIGLSFFAVGTFGLAFLIFTNELGTVDKKNRDINEKILKEIPRFVRTFHSSLSGTRDIRKIFEKYKKIVKEGLSYDLDVLITDLSTLSQEEALNRFAARINLPQISNFVNGVKGMLSGTDQTVFFSFMEQDMKVLARENAKREMQKRPGKVMLATVSVVICLFIMWVYPIGNSLIKGLQVFS